MILALDIGTTTVKAAVFDRDGQCLALGDRCLELLRSASPVEQEIPAESWLSALESLLPALLAGNGIAAQELDCVVVSGNGPTLVPVAQDGSPLAPAMTWMDRRAVEEAARAGRAAGRFLDPTYNLPKVLWFHNRRPDIYAATARFSACPDFVIGSLCGEWRTILPAEGFQPIIWDAASLTALGFELEKFPPFIKPGEVAGKITKAAAARFGLPQGIPVVPGGPDFAMSLLGTATTEPGRACDRAGTSEGINLCHGESFPDDSRLLLMPHIVEPYLNISGVISTTGKAVAWFRSVLGEDGTDYEGFFGRVGRVPAGAGRLLFLPYLSGERAPLWDPTARGAFVGLGLHHGSAEMARAVVESGAFAMRDVIETMESLGGHVRELRVTGNPGRNAVWNQIKADVTGRPLLVPRFAHAELLGDLCVGLTALGEYRSFAEAAERLVVFDRIHEPDTGTRGIYKELFGLYRESYRSLKQVFSQLASLPAQSGLPQSGAAGTEGLEEAEACGESGGDAS